VYDCKLFYWPKRSRLSDPSADVEHVVCLKLAVSTSIEHANVPSVHCTYKQQSILQIVNVVYVADFSKQQFKISVYRLLLRF
jgi:hypothetical protein